MPKTVMLGWYIEVALCIGKGSWQKVAAVSAKQRLVAEQYCGF